MTGSAALDTSAIDPTLCGCGSGLRTLRCCGLAPAALPAGEAKKLLDGIVEDCLASPVANGFDRRLLAVLDLAPDHFAALHALYAHLAAHGPAQAAGAVLRRFVAHYPNDVWARCELALRLLRENDMEGAETQARSAIRLAPLSPLAQEVAGLVLLELHRGHAAEHHLRRALALAQERSPLLLARLATSLHQQSRLDEARALYEEACAALPGSAEILLSWSRTEQAAREYERAAALIDQAILAAPENPAARYAKAELQARLGRHEAALTTLEGEPEPTPEAMLARGRVLDCLERHGEAFEAWKRGKSLQAARGGALYPADEVAAILARLQGFYTRTRLASLPRAQAAPGVPQPIFILGFPRSGTTLVEQILSAHSAIAGGDELPLIHALARAAPLLLNSPLPYPEALSELWMGDGQEGLEVLRDQYLRGARHLRASDPARPWFTDKMPLNETQLGLIHLLFPASPLLRLVRHPLDVILSVFSNQLSHGYNCASALESAALHFARIAELMEAYTRAMDLRLIELRYELLVAEPEAQIRRMLDFIGLPFEPRCLRFTENRRYARTASHAQVTEPLYARSRFRWRNYREQLAPAAAILAPVIARLGYTLE